MKYNYEKLSALISNIMASRANMDIDAMIGGTNNNVDYDDTYLHIWPFPSTGGNL